MWTLPTSSSPLTVVVEFVYGLPSGWEGSNRIALLLLRDRIVPTKIEHRATSLSNELGTLQLVTPGRGRALTNIPEVNEWLAARMSLGVG